jgi:hypothetical protein
MKSVWVPYGCSLCRTTSACDDVKNQKIEHPYVRAPTCRNREVALFSFAFESYTRPQKNSWGAGGVCLGHRPSSGTLMDQKLFILGLPTTIALWWRMALADFLSSHELDTV